MYIVFALVAFGLLNLWFLAAGFTEEKVARSPRFKTVHFRPCELDYYYNYTCSCAKMWGLLWPLFWLVALVLSLAQVCNRARRFGKKLARKKG